MSKALVIKNADFSENALDTITLRIPCHGISLSERAISLNGYGTRTITYDVIPDDTTDTVEWVSSNTDIVTVEDGVITVVGIGTCTVTAICGECQATVSVTVDIAPSINWVFGYLAYTTYNPKSIGTLSSSYKYISSLGTGAFATEYKLSNNYLENPAKCIKLPKNVGSVTVTVTNPGIMANNEVTAYMYFYKDESADQPSFPDVIHYVGNEGGSYSIRTEPTKTFTIPAGTDSIAFRASTEATYSASDDPNAVASSAGISITFNPVVNSVDSNGT